MKLPIPGIFPKLRFSGTLLVVCLLLLLALGAIFALGMLSGQLIRWETTNLPVQIRKLELLPKFTIPEDPEIEKEVKEQVTETVSQIKVRSQVSHPEKKLKPGFQEKPVIKSKPVPDLKQEMLPSESEQVSRLPISADQETFHLQREWVDEQLANFAKILQDARVEPITVDQQTFFQFKFIKKGSVYEALGLKKNDIIFAINDKMINNVTNAMRLLKKLHSEREIALTVKRKESEKILRYYIN